MLSNVSARAFSSPFSVTAAILGQNRLNSFNQFRSVDFGQITRCGPSFPLWISKYWWLNDEEKIKKCCLQGIFYSLEMFQETNHWNRLQCLAQAHFIGQNSVTSIIVQRNHPIQATQLIVTHFTIDVWWRLFKASRRWICLIAIVQCFTLLAICTARLWSSGGLFTSRNDSNKTIGNIISLWN